MLDVGGRLLADVASAAPAGPLEYWSRLGAQYLASGVELCAAVLIGLAAIRSTVKALILYFSRRTPDLNDETIRLQLGRWLALALEFELAADILRTAVAPTWNEVGMLAAIVVLRTALNFFLQKEIDKAASRGKQVPS
ncbi:MAG TPA: DUF1622 domain-containing protein [Gemmataceae bacterium]|nr:DUF1622 domain-containing protein [Gemmataceae bacterium]